MHSYVIVFSVILLYNLLKSLELVLFKGQLTCILPVTRVIVFFFNQNVFNQQQKYVQIV